MFAEKDFRWRFFSPTASENRFSRCSQLPAGTNNFFLLISSTDGLKNTSMFTITCIEFLMYYK
jgi:hypothetical protein